MPTIDIVIKSYQRDFKWLRFALDSISRNVSGYNRIILIIPSKEAAIFDLTNLPPKTDMRYVNEYGDGYLYQQWCKINACTYSSAAYLLFGDSDCIFTKPINLQDYVTYGKPEILYTSWDKVGDAIIWKKPTEKIMGEEVPYEFMRRNCLIYHRDTLVRLNENFIDLEDVIMRSERFSEFNLMGAYAYKHERERYNFINTDEWEYTEPKAIQLWSHASKGVDASSDHLKEYIRALRTLMLGCGIEPPYVPDDAEQRTGIEVLENAMVSNGIEPPK